VNQHHVDGGSTEKYLPVLNQGTQIHGNHSSLAGLDGANVGVAANTAAMSAVPAPGSLYFERLCLRRCREMLAVDILEAGSLAA